MSNQETANEPLPEVVKFHVDTSDFSGLDKIDWETVQIQYFNENRPIKVKPVDTDGIIVEYEALTERERRIRAILDGRQIEGFVKNE